MLPVSALLGAALVLAPVAAPRRFILLAWTTATLGGAALRAAFRLEAGDAVEPIAVASLPATSARIDVALLVVATAAAVMASALLLRAAGAAWRRWIASLACALAALLLLLEVSPLLRGVGPVPVLATALLIGGVLALLGMGWVVLQARRGTSGSPAEAGLTPVAAAGVLLALVACAAPHVFVTAGAAALVGLCCWLPRPRSIAAVASLAAMPLLAWVAWQLHVVAGPVGLARAALVDVPVSPAAAARLTPPLAAGAALLLLATLRASRAEAGALVLAAVAVLARIGHPLLAPGIEGWQTLLLPAGVLVLAVGAALARLRLALAGLVWAACMVPAPDAGAGASLLALGALLAAVTVARASLRLPGAVVAAALAATGTSLALVAMMHAQVVYAVAVLLLVSLAAAGTLARNGHVYSGRSTPH